MRFFLTQLYTSTNSIKDIIFLNRLFQTTLRGAGNTWEGKTGLMGKLCCQSEPTADARIYPKLESDGGPGGEVSAKSHST